MSFTGNNRPAAERASYLRAPRHLKASKEPARLPEPGEEHPRALAVPFDDRLRLDDGQNRLPSGPQAGQPDPEDAFLLGWSGRSYHKTDSRPGNASPYDSTKRGFR